MSEETPRDYGQGTFGTATKRRKISVGQRVNAVFDAALSSRRGFVILVLAIMFSLALVMTGIQAIVALVQALNDDITGTNSYVDVFWASLTRILNLGSGATWGERIISFIYWSIAISVTGAVIAYITTVIMTAFGRLGRGLSPVLIKNHVLILGWSPRAVAILNELAVAKSSERKPRVVVYSDTPRAQVEEEIGNFSRDLGKLRVITRYGSLTNPAEVARANAGEASSIIVLRGDAAGDASVVTTILAMRAAIGDVHPPVVAEIEDVHIARTIASATDGLVQSVQSQDIIARVTAQAARQPGLASVVLDLLDFAGNEIYVAAVPELEGKTYGDALVSFEKSTVIGLETADGKSMLNPAPTQKIAKGTKLVVIAEDDSAIAFTGVANFKQLSKTPIASSKAKAHHLLVIGWSQMGQAVLSNLADYLPTGSSIEILARKEFVAPEELTGLKFGKITPSLSFVSGRIEEVVTIAEKRQYDEIIVLGYRSKMSPTDADAQTLLTMLQMKHIFDDSSNKAKSARIVAEILDSSLLPLARAASTDDLVVSDVLSALLISQLSQNPRIASVITDLFDADGAAIHLLPVEDFAPKGTSFTFGQLVSQGRAQKLTVIGYRFAEEAAAEASTGVMLNPDKSHTLVAKPGDGVVVIRNS
jgi:Trk K+ transport system NAD-binding subunit